LAERVFIHLHQSEGYILRSAAEVFAGYISTGAVTPENEQSLALKAVELAIRMASLIDERVRCQDEID
jgi:hypothetical protein